MQPVLARKPHKLAGKRVIINTPAAAPSAFMSGLINEVADHEFVIEDWWENVAGVSWMDADGNPAAMKYAMRSAAVGLPTDNDVVYGKIRGLGHIIHVSELGDVIEKE